jgi:hypothetical protein
MNLKYSIVAGNKSTDPSGEGSNCWNLNELISQGYNIENEDTCFFDGPGDLENTDPILTDLQDNGGFTLTHAPIWDYNSPAMEIGTSGCADKDQRLILRNVDADMDWVADCDSGAVEVVSGGYLAFGSSLYGGDEGNDIVIEVIRPEGHDAVTVAYKTQGGNARPIHDYVSTSGILSWNAGDTTPKYFAVTLIDDIYREGDETIGLVLNSPLGGAGIVYPNNLATLVIYANDPEGPVENWIFAPIFKK